MCDSSLLNHRFVQAFHTHETSSRKQKRPHPSSGADAVLRGSQSCCSLPSQARIRAAELEAARSLLGESKRFPQGQANWRGRQEQDKSRGRHTICMQGMVQIEADRWEQRDKKQGRNRSDDGHVGSLLFRAGKPLKSARSGAYRVISAGCQSQA